MSVPSSGLKNMPIKKPAFHQAASKVALCYALQVLKNQLCENFRSPIEEIFF
jgi:hypothetical protein